MSVARPPRGPLLPFVRLVWFSDSDASHGQDLTREFGDIAGLTPSAYRAASPAQPNHVPVSDSFKTTAARRRRFLA